MNRLFILSLTALTLTAGAAAAEITGYWVADKAQCSYQRGLRDEYAIVGNTISNLEFECKVKSRSSKNGYTVAKVECCGEGECSREVIRYKLDQNGGLLIKIGGGPQRQYKYSCR